MSLSVSGTTWTSTAQSATRTQQQKVPGHVQTAADALGMSTSDVMSALKSGKSLNDIASDQGVSHEDLVAALKAGAPQEVQDSDDADPMIEALAAQTGVRGPAGAQGPGGAGGPGGAAGGHHHGPPPAASTSETTGVYGTSMTSAQQSTLSALSGLLGTDSGSLLTQLQSGTELTDLLSAKGVTLDQLSSELEEGLLVDARA